MRLLLLASVLFVCSIASRAQSIPVFDGTLYQSKPANLPMKPITIIYTGAMWRPSDDKNNLPSTATIAALARQAENTGIAAIDVEHWHWDKIGLAKYEALLQAFKQSSPNVKFGFYGVVPNRDYWRSIKGKGSAPYSEWQKNNNSVESIAQTSDVLFPSLYTFYSDQTGWKKYAIAQLDEARRLAPGKKLYVFLWPEYCDLSERYLPAAYWQMELDTAKQYADGIVIWGGEKGQRWDDNAQWWKETLAFIHSMR